MGDSTLQELLYGACESEVERCFVGRISPELDTNDSLQRVDRMPMSKHVVPRTGQYSKLASQGLVGYGYRNTSIILNYQNNMMGSDIEPTAWAWHFHS